MELCNQKAQLSIVNSQSMGRSELAQRYFPYVQPMSAWLKLKALLLENPDLAPLTQLKRRTFSPAEVNKIYQALGQPITARFSCFPGSQTFHSPKSDFH